VSKVKLDWRLFEKVAQQLTPPSSPRPQRPRVFVGTDPFGPQDADLVAQQAAQKADLLDPAKSGLTTLDPHVPVTEGLTHPDKRVPGSGTPGDIDERIRDALAEAQKYLEANPELQSGLSDERLNVNDLHRSIYLNDADIRKRLAPVLQQHFAPPNLQPGWVPRHLRVPRDINGDGRISRAERYAPTVAESEWKRMGSTPEGRQEWAANVRANLPSTGTLGGALAPGPRGQKPQRRLSINNSMIQVILRMAKKRGLTEDEVAAALFRPEPEGPMAIGYAGDVNQARLERALNAELVKRGLPPQLRHWQKPTPKHLRMPAAGSWGSFWESAFPSLMAKREKARSDEYDMRRQMLHIDRPAHHPTEPSPRNPIGNVNDNPEWKAYSNLPAGSRPR
jgi:hypothetical protein